MAISKDLIKSRYYLLKKTTANEINLLEGFVKAQVEEITDSSKYVKVILFYLKNKPISIWLKATDFKDVIIDNITEGA